ncbi:MAG: DsbA family protein [Rhizobiales bacterium]|nr:DsbA family protein [Hyphomicrobiales bacterium]
MIHANRRSLLLGAAALAFALPAGSALAVDVTALHEPSAIGEMALGSDTAKVTIVEYASASCPHCAAFHNEVFEPLKKEYIDTGKVRFLFREFPHNEAGFAAFMIARCAPKDKYFPLVDVFFKTQKDWMQSPKDGLFKIAQQAGFTQQSFDECLKNETVAKGILDVRGKAETFGVEGIPAFFVNGERYDGENTFEAFKQKLDPLLG